MCNRDSVKLKLECELVRRQDLTLCHKLSLAGRLGAFKELRSVPWLSFRPLSILCGGEWCVQHEPEAEIRRAIESKQEV